MTTGTSNGRDRGARHLARCVAAVHAVLPDLPIQVQIEPPVDLVWIRRLYGAGARAIGIHIESLDEKVRRRWTPGKATVLARALRGGVDRGGPRLRSQPRLDVPADRPRRGSRRARRRRAAADRDGRLSLRRALPAARGRARARRRRAGARATRSSPTSPTASGARCATRACAGPTRRPAARRAGRARRSARSAADAPAARVGGAAISARHREASLPSGSGGSMRGRAGQLANGPWWRAKPAARCAHARPWRRASPLHRSRGAHQPADRSALEPAPGT